MAEELYVDWDGLVYYDGKIKDYIDEKAEVYIKMGGFTKFANLPDPSVDNLNYIYKITDSFITNSDFKEPNLICSANTWVQCTEFDNVFLYTLFNEAEADVDLSKYATIEYVDKQIADIEHPTIDLDGYATEEYVDEAIRNIPDVDLSDYYTKGELDAILPDTFITSQDIDTAIETALEDVVYQNQLTEINESIARVETALEEKADKADLTGLASEQFVTDKIAEIDIPTKVSELDNDKNYITLDDIPQTDLSNYYTKSETDIKIKEAFDAIPETDLSDYSTTSQMQAAINTAVSMKADSVPFTDKLVVKNPVGGFNRDDSVQNMTIAQILTKLLGLQEYVESETIVDTIINEAYPIFTESDIGGSSMSEFQIIPLDAKAKDDNDNSIVGFYHNENDTVAGYQVELPAGDDGDPMIVYLPANAILKAVYQWSSLSNSWAISDVDNFKLVATETRIVSGSEVMYNKYEWDEEYYGGVISAKSNWRLEIEV